MIRPADLPDFDNPPVNEVVIGVQFAKTGVTGAQIGSFWQELREEFPDVEEQPPLDRHRAAALYRLIVTAKLNNEQCRPAGLAR